MKKIAYVVFSLFVSLFPTFAGAVCFTEAKMESKLNDLVFVVYCEDRTDETAMMLVLSTVYNRAQSHDINLLQSEVSKKNQYYCFNMKPKIKKIDKVSYNQTYDLVCDFIQQERSPITRARYFFNHKLVRPSFARSKKVVQV